jgi:hypothetical protein
MLDSPVPSQLQSSRRIPPVSVSKLEPVVGVYLLDASATQREVAAQQPRDTVQPGEDPHHGPGGVRKAHAELGEFVVSAFSILLVVVLPPVQLAAVLILPLIAYGVSALLSKRREVGTRP